MPGLPEGCFPISVLSNYTKGWKIRARVTSRGQLRSFTPKNGGAEGKVFNVDVLDCEGGEIRCNFFNQAAELHYDKMQVGKCFEMSKGSLRVANRQYNTTSHKYEITFDKEAIIEEVPDDAGIEKMKLNLSNMRSLAGKAVPCTVDLCGVVVSFKQPLSFTSKAGKDLTKREIVIADDSATSITVTLWGERAQKEDKVFEGNPVICLKGVTMTEFQKGRFGSLREDGFLILDPKEAEAERVRQWWLQSGSSASLTTLSVEGVAASKAPQGKPASLVEVRQAAEQGVQDQELFTVLCRLSVVQTKKQGEDQPLFYMACQDPKKENGLPCNRRVDASGFCPIHGQPGKVAPRLNLRCKFSDCKDSAWLTTFHEGAQRAIGMEAEKVKELDAVSRESLESALRSTYMQHPLQVTVRAKQEVYQGETRTNISCIDARPVHYAEHGHQMLRQIEEMLAEEKSIAGVGGA